MNNKSNKKKSGTLISKGIDMKGERKLREEADLTTGQPWSSLFRMYLFIASNSCLNDNSMYLCYKHKPIKACITHILLSHGKWCLASKISFMESEEEGTREIGERPREKHFP